MSSVSISSTSPQNPDFSSSPSSLQNTESLMKYLDNLNVSEPTSDQQVTTIMNLMVIHLPIPFDGQKIVTYCRQLEWSFQRSKTYTPEKASQIYQNFFEALSKKGFNINSRLKGFDTADGEETPIGWATGFKVYTLVGALIKAGANVNCGAKNHNGITKKSPIHLIIYNGYERNRRLDCPSQMECLNILLNNGCDPNAREVNPDCMQKHEYNLHPLYHAAENNNVSLFRKLIEGKASIDVCDEIASKHKAYDAPSLLEVAYKNYATDVVNLLAVELGGADLFDYNFELKRISARKSLSGYSPFMESKIDEIKIEFITRTRLILDDKIPKVLINIVAEYLEYKENEKKTVPLEIV